jgi:hypothetical protein
MSVLGWSPNSPDPYLELCPNEFSDAEKWDILDCHNRRRVQISGAILMVYVMLISNLFG